MGCRVYASIQIGGQVSREQFQRLLDELGIDAEHEDLQLEPLTGQPGCWGFSYSHPEVNYGSFPVEHFLTTEKIPFDRQHEGYASEFSSGVAYYRPELEKSFEFATDGGDPTLTLSQVNYLIERTQTREGLIAEIKEALGEGIPDLPPLKLDFDPFEEEPRSISMAELDGEESSVETITAVTSVLHQIEERCDPFGVDGELLQAALVRGVRYLSALSGETYADITLGVHDGDEEMAERLLDTTRLKPAGHGSGGTTEREALERLQEALDHVLADVSLDALNEHFNVEGLYTRRAELCHWVEQLGKEPA